MFLFLCLVGAAFVWPAWSATIANADYTVVCENTCPAEYPTPVASGDTLSGAKSASCTETGKGVFTYTCQ